MPAGERRFQVTRIDDLERIPLEGNYWRPVRRALGITRRQVLRLGAAAAGPSAPRLILRPDESRSNDLLNALEVRDRASGETIHPLVIGRAFRDQVAGAAFLVGALSGGRDVLQPLSGLRVGAPAAGTAPPVAFQPVNSEGELDRALKAAAGKPVMLDFYADWCISCKEMERFTFPDPAVRERLRQLVTLKAVRLLRTAGTVFVPVAASGEIGRAEAVVLAHRDAASVRRLVFTLDPARDERERSWERSARAVADALAGNQEAVRQLENVLPFAHGFIREGKWVPA